MSFKVDFSKMKKIHSDKEHTIMEHPDGHQVRISHKALSRPLRNQLSKLPMAEGGKVPEIDPAKAKEMQKGATSSGWQPATWAKNIKKGLTPVKKAKGGPIEPLDYEEVPREPLDFEEVKREPLDFEPADVPPPEEPLDFEPVEEEKPLSPMEAAAQSMAGMPEAQGAATDLAGAQKQIEAMQPQEPAPKDPMQMGLDAIAQQGKIEQDAATERAKAMAGEAAAYTTLQKHFEDETQAIKTELENFVSDAKDAHIDPNRYMGSMDTGQRIATALALALGGFGAGMTGGPNQVLDFINKQIDRDIDAQKQELGKKETLFSANLKRFNNLREATEMTRLMMQAKGLADMNRIAAKAAGPMAMAKAQQLQAAMLQQAAPTIQQMALRQAVGSLEASANKDPGVYPELIKAYESIDPKKAQELRQRYVPGIGMAFTSKDAADIKDMSSTIQGAQAGIKDLLAIAETPGKTISLTDRARAQEIRQSLIGALRLPITGPGAMNEGERKLLEAMIPDPTSMLSLDVNNKTRLMELSKQLQQKLDRLISARGLGRAGEQQVAQPEIKSMNGIKYQKVPGGWQKIE